ncbi:leucine-rich repeat domain-containing protein, partial [Treponema socranskii]|uniref:leucine-rich repeat protein n=1 Tax=Treponema socranskii TaxID=53419 RepID=UPI003D94ED5D
SVIRSGNEVPDGSTVIFTAVPDTANGRKVKEWKITGGSFISDPGTENSAQVQVTAPISVTLSFEKKSYTVSFGVQGGHGTLSAKKEDNSPFTSGSKASHGDVITFTAGPDEGYITEGWTGAEADAQDTKTARVTVTSDLEVNVTFKPIPPNTASYKIEHYKEALDGQYTATPAETDDKTGIVGTAAAVELKSYEGFEKDRQEPENAIISAGAVVKVYYKRKTVRLTFHLAGGNIEGVPDDAVREGKYGTTLETPVPVKEGCTLSGWDPAPPPVFPSSPAEYTAQWQALPSITVRITVKGDERVDEASSGFVDITGPKTWGEIKAQIEAKLTLKAEWQGGDYGAYAWKLGSENGEALTDGHTVSEDTTVYAVTNYTKFRMNGTVLLGYAGAEPRGRIIIPDNVTEIGAGAFRDCRGFTGSLDLSACTQLTKIERYAFYRCSGFTGILVFPRSLKEIKGGYDKGAFQGCTGLTGLDLSACTELTEIGDEAFYDCTGFTGSLDLSACTKLTKIGDDAFRDCSGFTGELKLPANITEIGGYAFYGCKGFTGSLDLSACTKLTKIGGNAFRDCSGFTGELKLPANITEIGKNAFSGCKGFTGSLDLSACTKLTKIGSDAFGYCSGFTGELKLPVSITEIGYSAFYGCKGFTGSLDLSACTKLTKIGSDAFGYCSGFTGALKLPVNLTEIGDSAFWGCTGFSGSLDLSACTKLTKIGGSAFSRCSGFTGELKLPVNLTEIGNNAFFCCTGFTGSLDLSACTKLTKIGDDAFSSCSGFTGELKLPVNLTEIGNSAFSGCEGFTGSLDLSACTKLTKIGSEAFSRCSGFTGELKLPVNLTEIGVLAFSGCEGFTGSLDLSACTKLTKIETGAFGYCSGFTGELKLPVNITEMRDGAFSGCTKAEIKLPQSITKIGGGAFGYKLVSGSFCKKVKVPNVAPHYDRIKALVTQSSYPEDRIEAY